MGTARSKQTTRGFDLKTLPRMDPRCQKILIFVKTDVPWILE